jgi:hypothetical protein
MVTSGVSFMNFICDVCSQSGDHPENSLANSGYILDMKVGAREKKKKRKKSFYILDYLLELIIKNLEILKIKNSLKSGKFGSFFLYHREIISISRNLAKNLSVKETIGIELYQFQKC